MALLDDEEPVSPMLAALRNKISRLADGSSIVQGVKGMSGEDQTAIATSFVPGVGDVAGAYADYKDISENWARMNALSKTAAVGAAALGAVPFLPSRSQMHAGGAALQDAVQKIKAYHGSPHDFDRFSTSQIGTGEGAQAYGHGLYFAEAEDVARGYRDTLSTEFELPEPSDVSKSYVDEFDQSNSEAFLEEIGIDVIKADTDLSKSRTFYEMSDGSRILHDLKNNNFQAVGPTKGKMYQVEIDASPDEFLDWDLPLSEQSDLVQKGFLQAKDQMRPNIADNIELFPQKESSYFKYEWRLPTQDRGKGQIGSNQHIGYANTQEEAVDQAANVLFKDSHTGRKHYEMAARTGGDLSSRVFRENVIDPSIASSAMQQQGIKGIRYKDGFSRGKEGGTSNYVVFDENLISIARKYGIAIPAAAAMLARQTGQNPEDMYEEDEA